MDPSRLEELSRVGWVCDACREPTDEEFYHFTSNFDGGDLCSKCIEDWEAKFTPVEKPKYHWCDCCQKPLGNNGTRLGEGGEVCASCWGDPEKIRSYFIHVRPETQLRLTDRGLIVLADEIDTEIPDEVAAVQDDDLAECYADTVDYLVRPPHPVFNIHAWRMLCEMEEVPSYSASCALAVRVEASQPHEVASVVTDDHGRHAMNVVFGSLEEYHDARNAWEAERDKNIEPYIEKVKEAFANDRECDDDLMAKATDSFAVYLRLTRRLSMYYG